MKLNCYRYIAILETISLWKMSSGSFKTVYQQNVYKTYVWYTITANQTKSYILIYMYEEDFALDNLQWLICHKTQPNQIIYI